MWSRRYIYESSCHHHMISINLSHILIFLRGFVPEVVVPSYAFGFIYIPGMLGFVSFITVQFYHVCKLSDTVWPDGRFRLIACLITPISSFCRYIWMNWNFNIPVKFILSNVCLRLSQLTQLSFIQIMGLCVFSLPFSLMMIVRMCVLYLIIIKSEVSPICHCLRLDHETMLCAIYFFSYSLITKQYRCILIKLCATALECCLIF